MDTSQGHGCTQTIHQSPRMYTLLPSSSSSPPSLPSVQFTFLLLALRWPPPLFPSPSPPLPLPSPPLPPPPHPSLTCACCSARATLSSNLCFSAWSLSTQSINSSRSLPSLVHPPLHRGMCFKSKLTLAQRRAECWCCLFSAGQHRHTPE